jgi:hypothetical protein
MLANNTIPENESVRRRQRIQAMLEEMPPEDVVFVERFVQFMNQNQGVGLLQEDLPRYHYPTVALPADAFSQLIGILPPVEGDALEETEALYDSA